MKPARVLIVDDSPVVQEHLRRIISADARLTVVGIAASGEEALAIVDQVAPDVISMDIQLPGIQGFETTRRIMSQRPTPIVVVSGIGIEEVSLTMEALKAGALGVVQKPVSSEHENYLVMANRLCTQLAIMSEVQVIRRRGGGARRGNSVPALHTASGVPSPTVSTPSFAPTFHGPFRTLAVGTSTGGPNALLQLLTGLGADFPLPIAVVQHMAPGFMEGFAEWLSSVTPFRAVVVSGPISLVPTTVYLAPTSRHLVLNGCSASPDDGPPVGNHRPSANVLFSSLARSSGVSAMGVLLTGMGEDGALGLGDLKAAGGFTIAEDESTAVVYGMPAAAVRMGAVRESLPLHGIAPRILELISSRGKDRMNTIRRVMLIEDSPTQAERLRAELTAAQLEVAVVSSAEAAFEQLSSLRPDVIVVDYHLPGRNGDDFCRAIKSNVNTRAIPVLMLTVDDSDAAQMRGLGSGADEYVAKSADPDILRARIGALLRESQNSAVHCYPRSYARTAVRHSQAAGDRRQPFLSVLHRSRIAARKLSSGHRCGSPGRIGETQQKQVRLRARGFRNAGHGRAGGVPVRPREGGSSQSASGAHHAQQPRR